MTDFLRRLLGKETREGRVVSVHVTGPDGDHVGKMTVGVDLPVDTYERAADPDTGELYGLAFYREGVLQKTLVPKSIWEQARARHETIDRAAAETALQPPVAQPADSPDKQAALERIARMFEQAKAEYLKVIIEGLSDTTMDERRATADLILSEVLPALETERDAQSRILTHETLSRLVAELRPPSSEREMSALDRAMQLHAAQAPEQDVGRC